MNILLIAPDQPKLNSIPEIRSLSETHRTLVLNGPVTAQDIYNYCRNGNFDIVHFATHQAADEQTYDKVMLSNGETLDLAGVTHVAKLAGAKLVFFNLCNAARLAAYLVKNGVPACIYTTIALRDDLAWQTPWHFYEEVRRHEKINVNVELRKIFEMINPGDGIYGWNSGIDYYLAAIEELQRTLKKLVESDLEQSTQIKNIVAFQQQLVVNQAKIPISEKHDRMLEYGLVLILALGLISFLVPLVLRYF